MAGRTKSGPTAQAPRNSAQASTPSRENIRASGAVAVMVAGIALADQNSHQMGTSPQETGATVRGRAQPEADRNMTFLSVSLVWVDALAWGTGVAGISSPRRSGHCGVWLSDGTATALWLLQAEPRSTNSPPRSRMGSASARHRGA